MKRNVIRPQASEKIPVLLIYPTEHRVTGLPVGLSTLTAVLHQLKYPVRIFDTAFYTAFSDENQSEFRAKVGMSKPVLNDDLIEDNYSDIYKDLSGLITEFKPRLVGITLLEPTYHIGVSLIRFIKEHFPDILLVAGGVFPILSPEIVIKEAAIDAICIGEGESTLKELCERLSKGGDITNIQGLWIKRSGKIYKNGPGKLHALDSLPFPEFSPYDQRLFYKPMQGRLYKMINIETSRGCPYNCTYCAAPRLKMSFKSKGCGKYYRKMSMDRVIEQIEYQIDRHNPEFLYFSSETFLDMSDHDMARFIGFYSKIGIPFWFQTRVETITEDRLRALKDVGMLWLTIGLEHGNEEFRKNFLKRKYSNIKVIECVKILKRLELGASINNIIGFPDETRDLIFDTIKLNRSLWRINPKIENNVFMFTPYQGCELYDLCVAKGLIKDSVYLNASPASDKTVLNFSEKWKRELEGLYRTFNLYIKLAEKHYPNIELAEQFTPEGHRAYQQLSDLLRKEDV